MGNCRIISGKWRVRRLQFPDRNNSLRPTTDRTRETLFNWLKPIIQDACCFDPFAGSGILSFEALSRGAKHVVMVEKDRQLIEQLKQNASLLDCESDLTIIQGNYWQYIERLTAQPKFDLVFLDPPFYQNLASKACFALAKANCLSDQAYIYLETEKNALKDQSFPDQWDSVREDTKGHVTYRLISATTVDP